LGWRSSSRKLAPGIFVLGTTAVAITPPLEA
jgi:hypothetical protein